jgi:hypothetical protein
MAIPSAMRCPGGLREQAPRLTSQDIATALRGPATTREVVITIRIVLIAIIVRQFFPVSNIPEGHQPERAGRLFDFTVGITGVIAKASGIPEDRAIDIIAVIEGKNIGIALG